MKGSTTFASRTEEVDKFSMPVLVLCFEPAYKPSIYGNRSADLGSHFESQSFIPEEQKLSDFLMSASYRINEDIQIELIMLDGNKSTVKLNLEDGQNVIDDFQVDVYRLHTLTHGLCYVIESPMKVSSWFEMRILVKDLNSENVNKLSNLNLFIASHESLHGITTLTWPYFELKRHSFSFNEPKTYFRIVMSVTSLHYQKGHKSVENCIENWMSTNDVCKKCLPFFFSFKNLEQSCQTNEDNKCWFYWSFYGKNYNNYKRCLKPMKTTIYNAKLQSAVGKALIQNNTVDLLLAYSSDEIKIEEETLMIGTSSYIHCYEN